MPQLNDAIRARFVGDGDGLADESPGYGIRIVTFVDDRGIELRARDEVDGFVGQGDAELPRVIDGLFPGDLYLRPCFERRGFVVRWAGTCRAIFGRIFRSRAEITPARTALGVVVTGERRRVHQQCVRVNVRADKRSGQTGEDGKRSGMHEFQG